jgi:hypothetical protein
MMLRLISLQVLLEVEVLRGSVALLYTWTLSESPPDAGGFIIPPKLLAA